MESKTISASPQQAAAARGRFTELPVYSLVLMFFAMLFNYLDRSILSVLIIPMKQELHLSDTDIGLLSGFGFVLVYALLGIPLARVADRYGRPMVVGGGMLVWSLATAACGMTGSFGALLAARIGVGVGEAPRTRPAFAHVGDLYSKARRPFVLGILNAGGSLGTALGLAGGAWIAQLYGWKNAFFLAGLLGVLLSFLILTTLKQKNAGAPGPALAVPKPPMPPVAICARFVWRQRAILLMLLGSVFIGLILMVISAWTPSFFMRVHHLALAQIGLTLGLVKGFTGVLGALLGGIVTTRLARRDDRWQTLTPALAALLMCPALAVFLAADSPGMAFAGLGASVFLLSATLGPIYAVYQSTTPPALRAQVCSLHVLVASIGIGAGPLLVGYLNESVFASRGAMALQHSLWLLVIAALCAAFSYGLAALYIRADIKRAELPGDSWASAA